MPSHKCITLDSADQHLPVPFTMEPTDPKDMDTFWYAFVPAVLEADRIIEERRRKRTSTGIGSTEQRVDAAQPVEPRTCDAMSVVVAHTSVV